MTGRSLLRRLRSKEDGFTMIVALGVMLVTSMLTAAAFLTVQSDARLTGADLNGKQAYAAAQAGIQTYLNDLNENSISGWWETCSNDTSGGTVPATGVAVPGSSTGATYTFAPVAPCVNGSQDALIDSAGDLRIEFTGTSGSATRTIVASFRTSTPLSYLWYTVHETLDPAADPNCANDPFYYQQTKANTIPAECEIYWTTGDTVNGPLYTQDQLLIHPGSAPSFQAVTSQGPSVCAGNGDANPCENATITSPQTVQGGAPAVQLPTDNSNLYNDAVAHGVYYSGTVNVILNGSSTATVVVCATTNCASHSVDLTQYPIIYASNASGSCNTTYSPNDVSYAMTSYNSKPYAYGPCGDIYVSGTYSNSLTLAAANDIVVGNASSPSLTNVSDPNLTGAAPPTGTATLGLVANQYVRVYHPATISNGTCTPGSASNPNVTIDAAVLTLAHSLFVDNYGCGSSSTGTLTVHGALAQYYRGAVATLGNGGTILGYRKNYNYDSRLGAVLPPYMFDLENTQWSLGRETLCSTVSGTC